MSPDASPDDNAIFKLTAGEPLSRLIRRSSTRRHYGSCRLGCIAGILPDVYLLFAVPTVQRGGSGDADATLSLPVTTLSRIFIGAVTPGGAVEQGAAEALMVDDNGFITEGSSSNAWIATRLTPARSARSISANRCWSIAC